MDLTPRSQGKVARYFTHGVGRTGDNVPVYADWLWPWWALPLSVVGLALLIFIVSMMRAFRSIAAWNWHWDSLLAGLPMLVGICVFGSVAVFAVMIGFWPVTRHNLGRHLENQVEGWPLARLEEEISQEGMAWRSSPPRLIQAHLRRLAWLYRKREELHGVTPPRHFQTQPNPKVR